MEYHRVFAHYKDELWVGAAWLAERGPLTSDYEYTVLPVARQGAVCITLPDGRVLCDYGPKHDHDPFAHPDPDPTRRRQLDVTIND